MAGHAKEAVVSDCIRGWGAKDPKGYHRVNRKVYDGEGLLHRWIYKTKVGPLLPNEIVRHTCDNPGCIKPSHLIKGSLQDNVADALERGRHIKGEMVGSAKLTEEDVLNMRGMYALGVSFKDIAKEFNVHRDTAYDAIVGRTWKHLK